MQTLKDAVKQLQEELQHKDEKVRQNLCSYTRMYSLTNTHTQLQNKDEQLAAFEAKTKAKILTSQCRAQILFTN